MVGKARHSHRQESKEVEDTEGHCDGPQFVLEGESLLPFVVSSCQMFQRPFSNIVVSSVMLHYGLFILLWKVSFI